MQSYVIGVAGGSGSGKSTAVSNITEVLSDSPYSLLPHDAYYKDLSHLNLEERAKKNFDHPNSLETSLLVSHIGQLQAGQQVEVPEYDFTTHTRKNSSRVVEPTPVIIVEGILLFEHPALRELFDLKIFIDTPADIRFIRRLQRDISERGRDMESVIRQYLKTVKPMYDEFVEPSKRFADLIIPEGGKNWKALEVVLARISQLME